jgi:hypothetical protein
MELSNYLREWAWCELRSTIYNYLTCPLTRRLQSKPVGRVVGGRPELKPALNCSLAPVTDLDERVPVRASTGRIDCSD